MLNCPLWIVTHEISGYFRRETAQAEQEIAEKYPVKRVFMKKKLGLNILITQRSISGMGYFTLGNWVLSIFTFINFSNWSLFSMKMTKINDTARIKLNIQYVQIVVQSFLQNTFHLLIKITKMLCLHVQMKFKRLLVINMKSEY